MIDTIGKNIAKGFLEKIATFLDKRGLRAIHITFLALITGLTASVVFYFGHGQIWGRILAVAILWLSGLFDAVDGTLARITNSASSLGALLDVTFDRIVEVAIFLSVAIIYEETRFAVLWNASMVILSMTVFLLTGSLTKNGSDKSFYYQPGLMERTEGFILFSLAWLFPQYAKEVYYICGILILFTAIQRFVQAVKLFRED